MAHDRSDAVALSSPDSTVPEPPATPSSRIPADMKHLWTSASPTVEAKAWNRGRADGFARWFTPKSRDAQGRGRAGRTMIRSTNREGLRRMLHAISRFD